MKKVILSLITILAVVGMLLPAAGCSDNTGGSSDPGTTDVTGSDEQSPSGETNQWLEYLKILPENETTLVGTFIQTSAYADLLNSYYADTSEEPFMPVKQLAFNNLDIFSNRAYSDEEWKTTLGFTIDDVTATILASAGPPSEYQAVYGTFTAQDIENAAKNGPLQEYQEVKTHAGYTYYSWGEDRAVHMSPEWRSNIRNLGRGHRLGYVDGFAPWMIWTDGIESMMDAYTDNVPSLADNEDYKLLAAELAKMNTVTAFFSSDDLSLSELTARTLEHSGDLAGSAFEDENPLANEPLLKPFSSFATGAGEDDNCRYMVIVIVNPDEGTAEANESLLEQRINESEMYPYVTNPDMRNIKWTDDNAIKSMEITSEGRLTVAKLYSDVIFRWKYFHYYGVQGPYSPLLLHE
ncbi:MAG: hypothetical protein JW712_04965 [Dehalococcoidales bacterium]|nr:hypothetical protein [Dehalococcoidales bacterium]